MTEKPPCITPSRTLKREHTYGEFVIKLTVTSYQCTQPGRMGKYDLEVFFREVEYPAIWLDASATGISHEFAVNSATRLILDKYVDAKNRYEGQYPLGNTPQVPDFIAALERTVPTCHAHVRLQRYTAACSAWAAHLEEILHMWDEPAQEEPVSP